MSASPPGTKCVLLDALGTLVELEPPWVHLAAALGESAGDRMVAAFRAEMAYYRDHSHEARDAESLAALRARCAVILSDDLGRKVSVEEMMGAIRFRAYEDAKPALRALRDRGLRLVVVSNWDVSLPEVLARVGLLELIDGVVTSAAAGARKPDPAIFAAALDLAEARRGEALHVGDTLDEDIEGARAAGVRALLIDRGGGGDIASLAEIQAHLA
jgi:putative hydrolase of the HAD superfamily